MAGCRGKKNSVNRVCVVALYECECWPTWIDNDDDDDDDDDDQH